MQPVLPLLSLVSCLAPAALQEPSPPPSALGELLAAHPVRPVVGELATDDARPLTFLVGGHLYGKPGRAPDAKPAASLRASIERLAAEEPDLFFSLGDFVRVHQEAYFAETLGILGRLGAPVFNAVGNHDVDMNLKRDLYVERFGPTWGGFRVGTSLFLLIDTELDPWSLSGEQLAFVKAALEHAPEAGIRNAFLLGHRVIFAAQRRFHVVLRHCNSTQDWDGTSNFEAEVLPALRGFAERGGVYWFAGDVGVEWSYGLFHGRDETCDLHFVATGIGDTEWDNVVRVRVAEDGTVDLGVIPLTDGELPAIDEADVAYWKKHFGEQ